LARDVRALSGEAWVEGLRYFDYALHLVVAECCGNLAIRQSIRKCWLYKRLSYGEVLDSDESMSRGYEEHIDILNHLHLGNGPGAASAMRLHLKAAAQHRAHQRIV
jgi:DNA-binding GntR family transcriptional regulator